jgi:SPP1 family predicted phage head-tail adaptor
MQIGKLRHQIELQSLVDGPPGPTGERTRSYQTYVTVWAYVRTLSGNERIAAEQVAATVTHEITIRYNPDFAVTPKHRILWGTRTFDIKDARNFDERDVKILMRCTEAL